MVGSKEFIESVKEPLNQFPTLIHTVKVQSRVNEPVLTNIVKLAGKDNDKVVLIKANWAENGNRIRICGLDVPALRPKTPDTTFTAVVMQLLGRLPSDTTLALRMSKTQALPVTTTIPEYISQLEEPDNPINVLDIIMPRQDITMPNMVSHNSWGHLIEEAAQAEFDMSLDTAGILQFTSCSRFLLLSSEGCQTNWHVDFSGTSVFYQLLRGKKTFYIVPRTPDNHRKFVKWSAEEAYMTYVLLLNFFSK